MKQNTVIALKKVIKEMVKKEVAKQINIVVKEITQPSAPQPKAGERKLASDPILNKVLNETQGGINDSYQTMGGGVYTSDRMSEVAGRQQAQPQDSNMPDFMKKAMSGHYGKVIKAVEKKHGTKN